MEGRVQGQQQVQGHGVYRALADVGDGRVRKQAARLVPPERRQIGKGYLVDFLTTYLGYEFQDAVAALCSDMGLDATGQPEHLPRISMKVLAGSMKTMLPWSAAWYSSLSSISRCIRAGGMPWAALPTSSA